MPLFHKLSHLTIGEKAALANKPNLIRFYISDLEHIFPPLLFGHLARKVNQRIFFSSSQDLRDLMPGKEINMEIEGQKFYFVC